MAEDNEEKLLTVLEGETKEQAIARWWQDFGMDHEATRLKRKAEYARQKAKYSIDDLKAVALKMDRFRPAEDI